MAGIQHAYQSTTPDNPADEISASEWNADHTITGPVDWPIESATPAAPTNKLRSFVRKKANRVLPHWIGPSGLDTPVQPALFGNGVTMFLPNHGSTAPLSLGNQWNGSGTLSHPTQSSGSQVNRMNRARYTSAATIGSIAGPRTARSCVMRESGFFLFARFAFTTILSDMLTLIGLSSEINGLPGDPSTASANSLGIGKDSADTNLQIISRTASGTATKVSTGYAPAAGDVLDLYMFCPPGGSDVYFRLVNQTSGAVIVDDVQVTATLPASTTGLYPRAELRTAQAAAVAIDIGRIYVEQDI